MRRAEKHIAFDTCHAAVPALLFAGILALTMFCVQPVLVALSLAGALALSTLARGVRATLAGLRWQLPMLTLVCLANPLFSASGSTLLAKLGPLSIYLESLCYGATMGALMVAVVLWFEGAAAVLTQDRLLGLGRRGYPPASRATACPCVRSAHDLGPRGLARARRRHARPRLGVRLRAHELPRRCPARLGRGQVLRHRASLRGLRVSRRGRVRPVALLSRDAASRGLVGIRALRWTYVRSGGRCRAGATTMEGPPMTQKPAIPALEVADLAFAYPGCDRPVLDHASFTVAEGDFALLTGATGSGKSTLLRLCKPEISPAGERSGAVRVFGSDAVSLGPVESARAVGFVFQSPDNQIVCDSVWHEMAFGLENLGVPEPEMRRRVAETCNFFGIEPWFRAQTAELSGGQRQLLALAATLAMRPRLLLLDEPTSMLDPIAEKNFLSLLFRANRELGITVVVATHEPRPMT